MTHAEEFLRKIRESGIENQAELILEFEERCGILQFEAGMSRSNAEARSVAMMMGRLK
jgi:hypothetical protein